MTAANPGRGEVAIGRHKLVVNFNNLCALEAATKRTVPQLFALLNSPFGFGFNELRTFVRILIDADMSAEEAGEFIESLGMVEQVVPDDMREDGEPRTQLAWVAYLAIREALDAFDAKQKAGAENPRKAA